MMFTPTGCTVVVSKRVQVPTVQVLIMVAWAIGANKAAANAAVRREVLIMVAWAIGANKAAANAAVRRVFFMMELLAWGLENWRGDTSNSHAIQ